MASGSDTENEYQRSTSPMSQGPAPTPGYGLDRSRSNSPNFGNVKDRSRSPSKFRNRSPSEHSVSRSRSRSPSAGSNRSQSADSGHSNRSRSKSSSRRSQSVASERTNKSHVSNRSRIASLSDGSNRSRSRSGSRASNKTRSRSHSEVSNRSALGSESKVSHRSASGSDRSRSSSKESRRSRSHSKESNRSRSVSRGSNRSKNAEPNRWRTSRSRSKSHSSLENHDKSRDNSRSNSPRLEIDAGSPTSEHNDEHKTNHLEERQEKKRIQVITSDSENEESKIEPSAATLFGDADDISSEEEKGKDDREEQRDSEDEHARRLDSDNENEQRPAIYDIEDKEPDPEPIPETRIDVEIPKISCDLGRDIHFVKLPNFLSVDTRPFDQETYEDEIDEEETLDEEGRARLKLKVENTIRWREDIDKEGNIFKESNARFVRWSDGSLSLHLGSEIFDVYKQPLQGDHNHLFIRQGTGLQGQAVFRTKLSFRPHSTESFTHRKMTLSLADRSQKVSGIKILSQVGVDPDQDRKTLLKKEEEKLRQTVRVKPRKRGEGGTRPHQRETFREEEGSDEDGAISLNAIKNKYKSGAALQAKGGGIYSSDEEGSDFEARRARKLDKPKALKDSESSESE